MSLGRTINRGLCLGGALFTALPVFAQEVGGLNGTLSFAQGLTLQDGDLFGQTDLGFGISDTTKRENFALEVNTQLIQRFDDGVDLEVGDPTFSLSYGIENRPTQISTALSYRRADADTLTEELNGTLVIDNGEREDFGADIALEFGREAKFGGTIELGYAETRYSNTQSTALVDSNVLDGSIDLRFQLDKLITATVGYSISETERVGQQDSRTETLSVGADFTITPTLTVSTSLGQSEIKTTNGNTRTRETGLNYSLGVVTERPNGEISFELSSAISETGRRTTAQIGRSFDTKRGSLSGRFGLTEGTDSDLRALYQISYQEELPRGSFNIDVDQSFSVNA